MTQDLKGMTEREAAKILDKSMFTMQQWRWKGIGPKYARIGGRIRYFQKDLEEYVQSRMVTPQGGGNDAA